MSTRAKSLFGSFAIVLVAELFVGLAFDEPWSASGLVLCVLLAAVAAGLVASLTTQLTSRAVTELASTAERLAEGELTHPPAESRNYEFTDLGRALDRLAKSSTLKVTELRDERDRMRTILGSMQEGVILFDGQGRIELVNPSLREMLLLGNDAVGKTSLEVVRHVELKELFDAVRESGEAASIEIEIGGLKPRRLLVRAANVGAERAVLAVFVDVTEMRRLESMRRDFVANVSHELRTPVTAIRSAAETLQNGIPSDPEMLKKFHGIIERNAERLHMLVEDLLDLSRIESREYRLSVEPVEVRALVAQVIALVRERADKKGMELVNEVGDMAVVGDRRALEHVISNLLDNAVKYSGPNTRVRIWSEATPQGVHLLVEDNGPGIEAKHLPRLFERFYRVDPGRSRELGGTGLGLSIVKHLVEAMSGRVSVESTPGEGTRFDIVLKAADAEPQSGKQPRAVA